MTENTEQKEAFKIEDLSSANWAMGKINVLEKNIAKNTEFADLEKQKIDDWLEKENKSDKESIEYFKSLLSIYLMELRHEDPKAKISTPNGVVSTRKKQDKWEWDDEQALEYFEQEQPELIKVEKKFNKTDAKKLFNNLDGKIVDENGCLVDFVKVTPQGETFTFKNN